jgi:hypothetical protein
MSGADEFLSFPLDQPLAGKADHLAQPIGIGVFSFSVRRLIIASVASGHREPSARCGRTRLQLA